MTAKELRAKINGVRLLFSMIESAEINLSYSEDGTKARISTNNSDIMESLVRHGITGQAHKSKQYYIITTPIEP